MDKINTNEQVVQDYVDSILDGSKIACKELKQACQRYVDDRKKEKYEFNIRDPEFVIHIIEKLFVHEQGQKLDATPLTGKPFLLEPWQKFIIYNLMGFYHKGTSIRRFQEALIEVPRKNGKTPFISAFSFAYSLLERKSGAKTYIVAARLRDAKQAFNFLKFNISKWNDEGWRIRDNNQERSIEKLFGDNGSIYIEALVARDSIVGNLNILDEVHEYKNSKTYDRMKKAQKAYTNKLTLGITTAGDDMNSFGYTHTKYCQKILSKQVKDEQMFVFITKADEDDSGYVDYTNPIIHEMANPNYRVTIRPEDMITSANQAQNKPDSRKEFLAKDLNVYTSSIKTYFDLNMFIRSDGLYDYGYKNPIVIKKGLESYEQINYEELAKLPIKWYGGADLSKMYDLTAVCLVGEYKGILIIIPHAFYPITRMKNMSEDMNIPYHGWEDDGWLTFCNGELVEFTDVANWFKDMRDTYKFDIKEIGYDRQMAREFIGYLKKYKFRVEDVSQKFWILDEGFRHIERRVYSNKIYYCHAEPYEYCVENVKAIETTNKMIRYEKTDETQKIDIFDASVIATIRFIENEINTNSKPDISDYYSAIRKEKNGNI